MSLNEVPQNNGQGLRKVNGRPKIVVPEGSPSRNSDSASFTLEGDTSLNDDLLSISGSVTPRARRSSRMSLDSITPRRSFDSRTLSVANSRSFGFENETHSGSMDFSPLGNNSIYEIVMNTRRKNWLNYPTVADIPQVSLSKNDLDDHWKTHVREYVENIKSEYQIFQSTNNIRNMNQTEQLKELRDGENMNEELFEENIKQGDPGLISSVPNFYFSDDFQLDNPRTFHKVLDAIDLFLTKPDMKVQTRRDEAFFELRDKLTDYLDIVETLLVTEISKSSHKFFHALSEVDSIQKRAYDTLSKLEELAQNIKIIDGDNINKKISHLEMIFKRKNVEKLEQGLLQAKLVLNKTDECSIMYKENKFDNCLELIKSIDHLIKGDDSVNKDVQNWTRSWPYKLSNLKTIPSLSTTREFLTNMKIEIGGKFSLQLSNLLIDDLRSFCQSIEPNETLYRIQTGSNDKKQTIFTDKFSSEIGELIVKLNRCEELTSAFDLYREKSIMELKSVIKIHLPTENIHSDNKDVIVNTHDEKQPNNGSTSGSKLSRLIKEQTPAEFQSMLLKIFTHALEALRRLYGHQKLLLDISLNELASVKSPNENQHNMITQLDIRTGINEIIRIIQLRTGKIIAVRRELNLSLRYDYFLKFYAICVLFIQECEVLSGEFLTKYLSNVLASQIKYYASAQSSKNYRNIKKKIDAEEWVPYIVDPSIQSDVNDIVSSIDIDPLSWTAILDMTGNFSVHENDISDTSSGKRKNEGDEASQGHRKSVVVGDKTFVASSSLLAAIEVIKELMALSINLPSIYLSNFEKLCYDMLQYYNNSAMASVTQPGNSLLKTGRNLSIMGESLDCLAEFVIIVQRFYQRLSNSSRDFEPFDPSHYTSLLEQYQASSNKIYTANAPPLPA
ncbi:hypothetical protein SMKI_04G2520 [Saccharomyces mikatae IFO 1815]|uniref:Vacuolar protein sorting-associated protein 54 n=1 Tax=Saccharomyces mikatae IFO 1815 TaxID=226126 RepID=A0AA35IY86_SACMI|nr:uncharacterized protein SMKI_04G2520 [Saccharomyces mikatae IFO 1815]CAI4037916.1 hypothetical protein SMKI_04G2520 [Saccharomyces mikatae IFO 1815]